jgi:hypothetical protein
MPQRVLLLAAALAFTVAAPASARITFFQNPKRNIHCVFLSKPTVTDPSVRCDTDFQTRFKRRPANCEFDFGGAFFVSSRGHGHAICVSDSANSPNAQRLKVGQDRAFGPFSCKAPGRASLRCTSTRGHGFFLSPARQFVY